MSRNPTVLDIRVELAPGELKQLHTVIDLGQCLMYDFPSDGRGEAYQTALMVCLSCLEGGDDTPGDARAAFVEAAHEVELFVLPDDGPDF